MDKPQDREEFIDTLFELTDRYIQEKKKVVDIASENFRLCKEQRDLKRKVAELKTENLHLRNKLEAKNV